MADFPLAGPNDAPIVLAFDGTQTSKTSVPFGLVLAADDVLALGFDGTQSSKEPQSFALVNDDPLPPFIPEGGGGDVEDVDLTLPGFNFIPNHCEVALDKLAEQFKGKVKFEDLICIWADRMQSLEQYLANILLLRSLTTAVGAQLDGLGRNLDIRRNGVDDDEYRKRLEARTMVIASNGSAPSLIEIIRTLDGGDDPDSISYTPDYPAGYQMTFTVPAGRQLWGETYALFVKTATDSGIKSLLFFEERDTRIFTWAQSADDPAPGILTGWLEDGDPQGSGGTWAEVV